MILSTCYCDIIQWLVILDQVKCDIKHVDINLLKTPCLSMTCDI